MGMVTAEDIDMYSDASGNFKAGGIGAYCGKSWTFVQWDTAFMEKYKPSIEFMELYGVAVAVLLWIKDSRIRKFSCFVTTRVLRT